MQVASELMSLQKAEVFLYELLRLRLALGDARSAVIAVLCLSEIKRLWREPRSTGRAALNMVRFAEMSLTSAASPTASCTARLSRMIVDPPTT